MSKVIVIGGGAAGMMAAIGAAYNGNTVELLEKNDRLGKKYLLQERSRYNNTNASDIQNHFTNVPKKF